MKKIAIVITRFIAGGASKVVKDIVDYGKEEFDFTIFTGCEGISEYEKKQLLAQYKIMLVDSLVRQISPLRDYHAYRALKKEFLKGDFSIVHTHTSKAGFIGRFAAKNAGIKNIIHNTHGSIYLPESRIPGVPDISFYKKMLLHAEKLVAPCTNTQIVLSNDERLFSIQNGLSREDNTIVIPNGIICEDFSFDENQRKSARKELFPEWDYSAKIILCVGRLSSEKGQETLIDAFITLLEENKIPNLKLVLVGDGSERTELEKKALRCPGAGNIVFCGHQNDARKFYAIADVYVQPSFYEGFGLALIEAMASGLPCVVSKIGGMSEIIKEYENALSFKCGDVEQLRERILTLINTPELAAKLSENAKLSVKKFDLRAILNRYYELYREK